MNIETPEKFMELFEEYIQYSDANPWIKKQLITGGDLAGVIMDIPHVQPYTWSAFAAYVKKLGYVTRLDEYKSNRRGIYAAYADVIACINDIMYAQKFAGAAVGGFVASIISADLGLVQKTVTEVTTLTDEIDYDALSESALEEVQNARRKTIE